MSTFVAGFDGTTCCNCGLAADVHAGVRLACPAVDSAPGRYGDLVTAEGPAAYWPLDRDLTDVTGQGHDFQAVPGP